MRKLGEAIDIIDEKNMVNMGLKEGRLSDNFVYCLSKLEENKNRARPAKRRRLDQESTANRRKRDRVEEKGGGRFRQSSEDVVSTTLGAWPSGSGADG
ncbi:unnamed protein product [Protopolystoma xenopodis]|uniref:Uncharacterized protein n=1 Tax=Protopolystoma xenopodis TaxID=117903 RepID=A0A3S5CEU9_9PLAT|nr:unnamed protein product [Protopolystoma xenopodis]